MKKIIIPFLISLTILLSGCGETLNNTPTKQVEMFFMNYQTLNRDVIDDLNSVLEADNSMNDSQKEKYKNIMKNHYKNLVYDIKDERINGDTAIVTVEIEVYDYSKAIANANSYLEDHMDEFLDDENKYSQEKFIDYRLNELENVKDKVKYTLDLNLTKIDDKWQLDKISSLDEDKILGIYEY
ncbi:MAG: hypothetical protein HFI86_05130 [Bacilli bacterium]|nr:hypothetical protein [Bacilli bacterium]MCI9434633.1 hypothetical protein [Bacilli bacterium]